MTNTFHTSANPDEFDALVIGAGFAGLYMLHRLRGMGLSVRVLEAAPDVGGVWYWNRYPGARCDVESLQYSYSFSSELEQEWVWTEKYAAQPEILRYLQHVADRFDLRAHIEFNTRVQSAAFDEHSGRWRLRTAGGEALNCRFCVMATGALSVPRLPAIQGIEKFAGKVHHTGAWPQDGVDFSGQRVGVIGTGSSGIQAIPQIAMQAQHLVVFQRTANFSVPAWNQPLQAAAQHDWKSEYPKYRRLARDVGTLYEFSEKKAADVSDEERLREYQRRWDKGGVNLVHAFKDLLRDRSANDTIAEFVRGKIRELVEDVEVADSLCPTDHPLGTKRICVDSHYYATFNRPNVTLVDLKKVPITDVTASGIRVGDTLHALDALVCATGYDALTGALLAMEITGRGKQSLQDKWADGPRTFLGLMTAGFPNFFIITGPGSPSVLVNMVVGIEQHVDWICDCLAYLKQGRWQVIEAQRDAEDHWVAHVNAIADKTLFPLANSWFLGANIPGKPRVFMPYAERIGVYRQQCQAVADKSYEGFSLSRLVSH